MDKNESSSKSVKVRDSSIFSLIDEKMRQVNIQVSEIDYVKYGLSDNPIDFEQLLGKVRLELAKEALRKCQELAEKAGISTMSIDEITQEVKASRDAKNHS